MISSLEDLIVCCYHVYISICLALHRSACNLIIVLYTREGKCPIPTWILDFRLLIISYMCLSRGKLHVHGMFIYILCLDRQALRIAWKMWQNVVEAHYLTPGTTWLLVAFFFGNTVHIIVLINDTLFTTWGPSLLIRILDYSIM